MIFLGIPTVDSLAVKAIGGILHASQKHKVLVNTHCSSNLTNNFNVLWCNMLNSNEQWDYFAMLHSDIAPPPFWLDILVDELEDNQLKVLSTLVPIKNELRVTSTALLDIADKSNPKVHRISYDDVRKLPKTFTQREANAVLDIPGILLLNTGCWVCKVDEWCKRFTGFNTRSLIKHDGKTFCPFSFTEDWDFSLWCSENSVRTGATSALKVHHFGMYGWQLDCDLPDEKNL